MTQSLLHALAKAHTDALNKTVEAYATLWDDVAADAAAAFKVGIPILFCGNGGSACDAMHIAGEFVGRFVNDRVALPAIALSADSGIITAVGNDYGFEQIFSRQVEAYGRQGGMLVAMSTSGRSPNVMKALEAAKTKGLKTVLLTGERGRDATQNVDYLVAVPSTTTAHIQEVHMLLLHALASLVESQLGLANR